MKTIRLCAIAVLLLPSVGLASEFEQNVLRYFLELAVSHESSTFSEHGYAFDEDAEVKAELLTSRQRGNGISNGALDLWFVTFGMRDSESGKGYDAHCAFGVGELGRGMLNYQTAKLLDCVASEPGKDEPVITTIFPVPTEESGRVSQYAGVAIKVDMSVVGTTPADPE